jgi:hypothetical protein
MRFRASVSFESDWVAVKTTQTEIVSKTANSGLRAALAAAKREHPGARWRSMVVVLEKIDDADQAEPEELPSEADSDTQEA